MTHEQIESAIERLRELGGDGCITNADIIDAVFSGNNFKVRDALIALLEQADPDTHMKLPVDADGVPIHVGDKVTCESDGTDATVMTVTSLETCAVCEGIVVADNGVDVGEVVKRSCYTYHLRHYHKPTVEDVLRVFARTVAPEIVWDDEMYDELLAKYADKLREAMADDDAR